MVYPIVKFGDPVLEREAEEVTEFDTPDLHKFLDDMFESMYAHKGVGLAAPQIGISRKIAVIDVSNGEKPEDKLVLINPTIVKIDGKQEGRAKFGPGHFDLIVNPILDNSYEGFSRLDFAPSARIAYHIDEKFAVGLEEYADFGPLRHFFSASEQSHQLFLVADYDGEPVKVETGIGFGLTQASDNLVLKLILSSDLN